MSLLIWVKFSAHQGQWDFVPFMYYLISFSVFGSQPKGKSRCSHIRNNKTFFCRKGLWFITVEFLIEPYKYIQRNNIILNLISNVIYWREQSEFFRILLKSQFFSLLVIYFFHSFLFRLHRIRLMLFNITSDSKKIKYDELPVFYSRYNQKFLNETK